MKTLAELRDFELVLRNAGYDTRLGPLGHFSRVLLAENPYALLAILEMETWDGILRHVADVQAELTQLAALADSASIRWDLYVLVHVRTFGLQSVPSELLESIESDTKYARKFVRVNLIRDARSLDRALRPFLPLRPALALEPVDPLNLLRVELLEQGVSAELSEYVLERFESTGEVTVP